MVITIAFILKTLFFFIEQFIISGALPQAPHTFWS